MRQPPAPPPLTDWLAEGPVSLFLDFDGTLVELAPLPDAIRPATGLNRRLQSLAGRLDGRLAVVSGRAIADIERHVGPLPLAAAGSHGSDIRRADGSKVGAGPQAIAPEIEANLRAFAAEQGLDYEHKPHGGALHYRAQPEREDAARTFARQLATQHGWGVQEGKSVVELVAVDASKGAAVRTLMAEPPFAGSRPVFVGDDLTDEAGFEACADLGGCGILVGRRSPTGAAFALPDVGSVHRWLGL